MKPYFIRLFIIGSTLVGICNAQDTIHFYNGDIKVVGNIWAEKEGYIFYTKSESAFFSFLERGMSSSSELKYRVSDLDKVVYSEDGTKLFSYEKYKDTLANKKIEKRNFVFGDGKQYYIDNHWISEHLYSQLLRTYPEAYAAYETGEMLRDVGITAIKISLITFSVGGLLMLTSALKSLETFEDFRDNPSFLIGQIGFYGGLAGTIASYGMLIVSPIYRYVKAFNIYNEGVGGISATSANQGAGWDVNLELSTSSVKLSLEF